MTDKEFKRLSRAQLIEIIYRLQLELEKVNDEKQLLESELKDKRLRLSNAGNIADAALEINDCFRSAQNAAEQYLNEIKAIREETNTERQRILKEAKAEAEAIIAGAKKKQGDYDSAIDVILKEDKQSYSDNGRCGCYAERKEKYRFQRKSRLKQNENDIAVRKPITRHCEERYMF